MHHYIAIILLVIWAFFAVLTSPAPIPDDQLGLAQHTPPCHNYGEPVDSRISLVITSKFCVCLLCGLLGYRIRQFHQHGIRQMTLTHIYAFIDNVSAITFIISAAFVHNGISITTPSTCEATLRLCLLFYTAGKVSMYLFLVERVHVLRAPHQPRCGDYLWLFSTIAIFATLGAIGVAGFVSPLASLSKEDGRCRIGLQPYSGIPLLVCDVVINMLLTLVFIYLLSPLVQGGHSPSAGFVSRLARAVGKIRRRPKPVDLHVTNQIVIRKVERLLLKTLIGCVLVVLPAAGNLTALCVLEGRMPAFMCLTICIFDVTFAAVILHWLTVASADKDKDRRANSTTWSDGGPLHAVPTPMRRKSAMSDISQELNALDANMLVEEYLQKLQLDESSLVMETNRKPSLHSAIWQGRNSRHSTLVADS